MPAPLIVKLDRLAASVGEPPAQFFEVVSTLPGLEAAHFLASEDGQRVGLWVWRGREGMQDGHAALQRALGHIGPPPMIEERVLDVLAIDGDISGAGATLASLAHIGPFSSPAQREAHVGNAPRVQRAFRGFEAQRASLVLSDPAGRDFIAAHLWNGAVPDAAAVRDAIDAEPLPEGVDGSLLQGPSRVEVYRVVRSIRPAVTA